MVEIVQLVFSTALIIMMVYIISLFISEPLTVERRIVSAGEGKEE